MFTYFALFKSLGKSCKVGNIRFNLEKKTKSKQIKKTDSEESNKLLKAAQLRCGKAML